MDAWSSFASVERMMVLAIAGMVLILRRQQTTATLLRVLADLFMLSAVAVVVLTVEAVGYILHDQ